MGKAESDTKFKALPASPPAPGSRPLLVVKSLQPSSAEADTVPAGRSRRLVALNRKENLSHDPAGPEPALQPEDGEIALKFQ